MDDRLKEEITKLFPKFKVLSKEELDTLNSEGVSKYLLELETIKKKLGDRIIQLQTQEQAKKEELEKLEGELQEKFGVSTHEELFQLRQTELDNLDSLYADLQIAMEKGEAANG